VVFSLEKWHQYTYGRHVKVYSDHKPLQSISKKALDKAPKRLQGMLVRALAYDIDIEYKAGKRMLTADTLSRAYLPLHNDTNVKETRIVNVISDLPIGNERLRTMQLETQKDGTLTTLKEVIQHGWPDRDKVPPSVGVYHGVRDELAIMDGLVFRGLRLIIPKSLRKVIMADIHLGHQGVDSSLRHARESVYWPGMTNDIRDFILRCETCKEFQPAQQKETFKGHDQPQRPWQKVGCDLFSFNGKNYMVTVCYFSNFWEIDRLYGTLSKDVISKLKAHFARYGIPDELVSDNGPQFSSDSFKKFVSKWDIKHTPASPHYPQSNGKAESAVKAAKTLLRKTERSKEDPFLALLNIRNTPQQGIEISPAQRSLGRRTKTLLPTSSRLLKEPQRDAEVVQRLKQNQDRQKLYYNRGAKDLPALKCGDVVRVKPQEKGRKSWFRATVVKRCGERSYMVKTFSGKLLRRNRVHLRKDPQPGSCEMSSDTDEYMYHGNESEQDDDYYEDEELTSRETNTPSAVVPTRGSCDPPAVPTRGSCDSPATLARGSCDSPVSNDPQNPAVSPSKCKIGRSNKHAQKVVSPVKSRYGRPIKKPSRYNNQQ
jgi:hypothetical protein